MKRVGLVGWRGMVGSVLMQRMREEKDFEVIDPVFFTTSNPGGKGPAIGKDVPPLKDASNIDELKAMLQDAVRCHFEEDDRPRVIRLHLVKDEVIAV